ncbi:acid phosphatase [Theileria orientalis strain Shintoku]|uniref:Acid phosphatase n=1 Tax=Theileria orientalis strain Shintoku TaxID=869250 RepID=J4CDF4_THEOR|nr:acid phosphatase [Theileria orientalis strain Shintoku]BAM41047.1 acid phosphatase [Theileria orientalis strain Shintoku]|eukprot:XP_009691348.1 acid phosphatase [Theileria orientalis strain Shintoku]
MKIGTMCNAGFIAYSAVSILLYSGFANASLRFVSLGNWGTGNKTQRAVAEKLKEYVKNDRVTYLVSPGSNFDNGVSGLNDDKWSKVFESVYYDESGAMDVPMFTVLGSEDWQGDYTAQYEHYQQFFSDNNVTTLDQKKGTETSNKSPRLIMPNWWYHFFTSFSTNASVSLLKSGHKDMSVGFVFVDTWILSNQFPYKDVSSQAWEELKKTLEIAPKVVDYIVVVGDKPVLSSGSSKGDTYLSYKLLPLLKQAQVDAYLAGYDADMELLDYEGVTLAVVGSSGSKGRKAVVKSPNSVFYSEAPGFLVHELSAREFTTKFVNGVTGEVLYTHTQPKKNRRQRQHGSELKLINKLPEVVFHPVGQMGVVSYSDAFTKIIGTLGLIILAAHLTLTFGTTLAKA